MKPNNLVLDQFTKTEELFSIRSNGTIRTDPNPNVYLLDFGLSESYLTKDGNHVAYDKIDRQLGNKFFMSLSQLKKNSKISKYFILIIYY